MANPLFFSGLMLSTGIGIPVMAALSASLGTRYGSSAFAASVLFLVALIISVTFLFAVDGGLKQLPRTPVPFYFYCGGVFVAFYVLSVTWVAPQFGAAVHAVTPQRLVGLLLMAVGVFQAVRRG